MKGNVARSVTLRGGPCDGFVVTVADGRALLMEDGLEPGRVARYRPSRKKGEYTFRGYDRVVARMAAPGSEAA